MSKVTQASTATVALNIYLVYFHFNLYTIYIFNIPTKKFLFFFFFISWQRSRFFRTIGSKWLWSKFLVRSTHTCKVWSYIISYFKFSKMTVLLFFVVKCKWLMKFGFYSTGTNRYAEVIWPLAALTIIGLVIFMVVKFVW